MTDREKILVRALRHIGSYATASMYHDCEPCHLIKTAQAALRNANLKLKVKG